MQTLAPMQPKRLAVKLNGAMLVATDDVSEPFPNPDLPLLGAPETLAAWTVPVGILRDGPNEITITVGPGEVVEVAFLDVANNVQDNH